MAAAADGRVALAAEDPRTKSPDGEEPQYTSVDAVCVDGGVLFATDDMPRAPSAIFAGSFSTLLSERGALHCNFLR